MPDPQGQCTFPSLGRITSATFTLSHGITPSSAVVNVDYQATRPQSIGTLSFQFGRTRVDFPGSRINNARGTYSRGRRIQFQIFDRRWKWQSESGGGSITGLYNERRADGSLKEHTEQTPQQLASMLLNAMGETGYDVSRMPNGPRPTVDWVASNPAQELTTLCDSLGCRIVLHLDNRVRIHRKGVGAGLPDDGAITHSYGIDPPERPDSIRIVGGESQFQSRLHLFPIGQDTDGTYKRANDLSYKPKQGWQHEYPHSFPSITDPKLYELASRDVFRLYEIDGEQSHGGFHVPGHSGPAVRDKSELLPLGAAKLELNAQNGEPAPAEVYGKFFDDLQRDENQLAVIPTFANTADGAKCPAEFTIDAELGYVRFNQPVYLRDETPEGVFYDFPIIAIETSYSVTNQTNHQKDRYSKSRDLPGRRLGTGERPINVPDLQRGVIAVYKADGLSITSLKDSRQDFDREANALIDQHAAQYQNVETTDITYAGIRAFDLDGLRQQVTWKVGGGPATTQISTNTEHNFSVPSYEQRREREFTKVEMKKPKPKKVPRG